MMNRDYLKQLIFNRYTEYSKSEAINSFAKEIGVSRATLYNILRYMLPKEEVLIKIGNVLDLDYNKLFRKEKTSE